MEIDVSGSERREDSEMVREGRALVASGGADLTQIDPGGGQGLAETLQARQSGVCLPGRLWRYQPLSIWRISTCFLSARELVSVDVIGSGPTDSETSVFGKT